MTVLVQLRLPFDVPYVEGTGQTFGYGSVSFYHIVGRDPDIERI